MSLHPGNFRLPRKLEADGSAQAVRRALLAHTAKLWPGGELEVPVTALSNALREAVARASRRNLIRCGFEDISDRLENERKGIAKVRREAAPGGERISRLILFSNDGADRLYRHIEQLMKLNASRLLGIRLEADSLALGAAVLGKERRIKVTLAEHKDAVTDILRAIAGRT